jgi:hypothetical protein
MSRRSVKAIVIAACAVGLSGAATATAWADTFTPGIEEPTGDVGLPGGAGNDLTGSAPMGGGNQSSATGTNGTTYGSVYGDSSSNSSDDQSDGGYWRNSANGSATSSANSGY